MDAIQSVPLSDTPCGACGNRLPLHTTPGAPRKCCDTERCKRVYYAGHGRRHCQRCRDPLPRGRAYQRAAICGKCFVDLITLAGGT